MSRSRTGFALSLLAICLQVVVCTVGGRLCFQSTAIAAGDDCLSICCSEEGGVTGAALGATAAAMASPLLPSDSGCCLNQHPETMAATLDSQSIRMAWDVFPNVPATIERTPQDAFQPVMGHGHTALAANPPPALGIVHTTILQL